MDPAWLNPDVLHTLLTPPIIGRVGERSASQLRSVVEHFLVGTCERYRKRDVDGIPGDETLCNFYVRDLLLALGVSVPLWRANNFYAELMHRIDGHVGWTVQGQWSARALANAGYPVVACWTNPNGPHGHVALVVPSRSEIDHDTTFTTQAGSVNFVYGRLEQGFGPKPVSFFAHP